MNIEFMDGAELDLNDDSAVDEFPTISDEVRKYYLESFSWVLILDLYVYL